MHSHGWQPSLSLGRVRAHNGRLPGRRGLHAWDGGAVLRWRNVLRCAHMMMRRRRRISTYVRHVRMRVHAGHEA